MNWLNDLSVRNKLLMVLFVVLVGYIAIGSVYSVVLQSEQKTHAELELFADLNFRALQVSERFQAARRAEADFFSTGASVHNERHAEVMAQLLASLNQLEAQADGSAGDAHAHDPAQGDDKPSAEAFAGAGEIIEHIRSLAIRYQEAYDAALQTQIALGLDENSGLQGAFRRAVREAEKSIANLGRADLQASMLTLRRHEKDFLLRGRDEYLTRFAEEQEQFARLLSTGKISSAARNAIAKNMAEYYESFGKYVEATKSKFEQLENLEQIANQIDPEVISFGQQLTVAHDAIETQFFESQQLTALAMVSAIMISGVLIVTLLMLITGSFTRSLYRIQNTIAAVASGDFGARSKLAAKDEVGELARAFDGMLDERISVLAQADKENEALNDSIIRLLEAVSTLSELNLTVQVPVSADVTGPVADAMNLMAKETAKVLGDIRDIADQVALASTRVLEQSDKVSDLAVSERKIVEDTIERLEKASNSMNQVAKQARACNEIAAMASTSTRTAMATVTSTAAGMTSIRETIAETEKRIKRLGERSQEINGVVEIINNIADRTQVLALNASMQAAAAGDAGRGFAVVADEVQRLAESSRQSTSEIASLVSNIQAETAETMATMNTAITEVIEGTELAQAAGGQMEETQRTTTKLAEAVDQIAKQSQVQAQVSLSLREEAAKVQQSTDETRSELEQQAKQAKSLVEYAKRLVDSVSVFVLPESVKSAPVIDMASEKVAMLKQSQ